MDNMVEMFPDKSANEDDNPARLRRQLIEAQEQIKRLNHTIDNYKQELNTVQIGCKLLIILFTVI